METYQIKDIYNQRIFEAKCECFRHCVILAVENNVNLSYANLKYANLRHVNLSNADLSYANLENADLENANLRNADLSYTNLSNADLENVDLSYNANLFNAKGIIYINYCDYDIYVQHNYTKIGCQYLTNNEWLNMSINDAIELGCKKEDFEKIRNICKNALEKLEKEK